MKKIVCADIYVCLNGILFENVCKKLQMTEADSKVSAGPRLGF